MFFTTQAKKSYQDVDCSYDFFFIKHNSYTINSSFWIFLCVLIYLQGWAVTTIQFHSISITPENSLWLLSSPSLILPLLLLAALFWHNCCWVILSTQMLHLLACCVVHLQAIIDRFLGCTFPPPIFCCFDRILLCSPDWTRTLIL